MYTVLCALFSVNVLCFILQADALVNTTDANFGFGGFVAQALLKVAGAALKDECASKAPVPVGDVAVTGAGNMKCKHIIHAVLPNYDGPGGQSEKVCSICAIFLKKSLLCIIMFLLLHVFTILFIKHVPAVPMLLTFVLSVCLNRFCVQ